jgi:acetyltransferase-like isoleucine patch superfamily enzyme
MGIIYKKIVSLFKDKKKPGHIYTKDFLAHTNYKIGEFSNGNLIIMHWGENADLQVGNFCSFATNVKIFLGGNHRTDWVSTYPFNVLNKRFPKAANIKGHPSTKGDVIIGNDVWIANDVIILSGVTIGDGAVIAAGAVITKNIGAYEVWGGNPARLIKKRFSADNIEKLLKIKWWDWNTEKINNYSHLICSTDIELFIKEAEATQI